MNGRSNYARYYMIFSSVDGGFGKERNPSGYVRIEVNNGRGRLSSVVQDLREDIDRFGYGLFLLLKDGKRLRPVYVGEVGLVKGKGEVKWDFDAGNIQGTGLALSNLYAAAVAVRYKGKSGGELICPMAACQEKSGDWIKKIKEALKSALDSDTTGKYGLYSKYDGRLESKTERKAPLPSFAPVKPLLEELELSKGSRDEGAKAPGKAGSPHETLSPKALYEDIGKAEEKKAEAVSAVETADKGEDSTGRGVLGSESSQVFGPGTGCPFLDGGMRAKSFASCVNCQLKPFGTGEETQGEAAGTGTGAAASDIIQKFIQCMDMNFELVDPFGTGRSDYRWWKAHNPVQLNNIMYQCGIRASLIFNPFVMMAHYKYRYIIVGVYLDAKRNMACVVCGVPGVYGTDKSPFGDVCKWVQPGGSKAQYGAFGYWLVYIDPATGKFLVVD